MPAQYDDSDTTCMTTRKPPSTGMDPLNLTAPTSQTTVIWGLMCPFISDLVLCTHNEPIKGLTVIHQPPSQYSLLYTIKDQPISMKITTFSEWKIDVCYKFSIILSFLSKQSESLLNATTQNGFYSCTML